MFSVFCSSLSFIAYPLRFIPTRVGYTALFLRRRILHLGSSHACGVYAGVDRAFPPARRFIPTRVGYTYLRLQRAGSCIRFIPTRVGYMSPAQLRASASIGSSPRVWGIHFNAGLRKDVSSVHPHACGVYFASFRKSLAIRGSSPRVWGIRGAACCSPRPLPVHPHACGVYSVGCARDERVRRFIPTRVGYTSWLGFFAIPSLGSSPRVWGIPVS